MKNWILAVSILLGTTSMIFSPITSSEISINTNITKEYKQDIQNDYSYERNSKISVTENAGNFNDYADYDDNDYGGGSSKSSSGSGDAGWILILWHIIPPPFNYIAIVVAIIFFYSKRNKFKSTSSQGGSTSMPGNATQAHGIPGVKYTSPPSIQVPDNSTSISIMMKESDANFDTAKFLSFAEEAYLNIQEAWTNNDFEKIRVIEHEALFQKHERQLNEYKNNGTRNVLERISVNQSYLYKLVIDNQYEHVSVLIDATMNDYIINISTNQILRGDYNTRWRGRYILTFTRSIGKLTGEVKDEYDTNSCPNCGAPIEISSAGKCKYCDFLITSTKHDWVVSDFDCIKPSYKIETRGVVDLRKKEQTKNEMNYNPIVYGDEIAKDKVEDNIKVDNFHVIENKNEDDEN